MNTNDFYKELFEKYALDEKKIKRNALKAAKTPAWQRAVSTHWKTAVGAAAAVAVTVGAVAYTVGNSGSSIDIESPDTLLSASQRLKAAEQNYYSSTETDDMTNIYVSFLEYLSFRDLSVSLSALTDCDEIEIECLYLNDSTVIRGKDAVDTYAESDVSDACIAGAKLFAPVKCYRDIQDLSKVYLAELGSDEINDDTFAPIDFDDKDPLTNDYDIVVTTASAESTTTPFVFEAEITVPGSTSAASTDISIDTTTEPEEDSEPDESDYDDQGDDPEITETDSDTNDAVPESSDAEPSDTTTAETDDAPEVSETTAEITVETTELTSAPTIGLMTQIYQLNVENALETVLADNYAIVLTRSEAYIYTLGGLINESASVYKIDSPKLAYSGNNTVILTGCGSSKRRNTVLVLNTKHGKVSYKEAGESFGEAEIGTIHHSFPENKYFLKAVAGSTTYMYELILGGETDIQFRPLFEFAGTVSPAGSKNGKLWFAATDENMKYSLYSFDIKTGAQEKLCGFGTECKIRRSRHFDSFLLTVSGTDSTDTATFVFDASTASLIPVTISSDASISSEKGTIYIGFGGKNYTVSVDGSLAETNASVNFLAKAESNYSVVSSDSEKVVVAENPGWSSD